jgi:Amt family ammonium transporter
MSQTIHYSSLRQPIIYVSLAFITSLSISGAVFQQSNSYTLPENVNPVDVVWVLVSAMLVLFMTPGVAFFYGGMVKHNSFISTMMHSFVSMGVITFVWICFGYVFNISYLSNVTFIIS